MYFHVNRQHRQLISKLSFSHDTCSQLTWKSHAPHTPGGTFQPTLPNPFVSTRLMPKLKFVNWQRHCLTSVSPVHWLCSWYMHPVDMKLMYTHTLTYTLSAFPKPYSFFMLFHIHRGLLGLDQVSQNHDKNFGRLLYKNVSTGRMSFLMHNQQY